MRDFCSPSFNFLCACANRKGQRWTGREGSYVFHFVNQLPVRHPEEVCHANASVAQIFLRKRHTLTRTSWLRKTEWVSIKTSTHKSTTKLRNFPSAVTNGGFQLILYTSSQLTAQNARHMVVLLFGVFFILQWCSWWRSCFMFTVCVCGCYGCYSRCGHKSATESQEFPFRTCTKRITVTMGSEWSWFCQESLAVMQQSGMTFS